MNLRHRLGPILILGLILGLALLGRESLRPDDAEPAPAKVEKISAVAEPPASTEPSIVTQPAATSAPNVSPETGIFRGRVIDAATRQPVREFALEFHAAHQPKPGDVAPGARTFRSKDGRFEWQGIPARLWVITANARGYQRFDLDLLQIPAGTVTEVVMPLQRGFALRGRVYDETSGEGIAAASLTFREAHVGRYEGNFRMRVSTTTSKDGSFVLDGVPRGSIILSVSAPKYTGREIDVLIGEKMAPLQIPLVTGGAITGYLAAADGVTPVAGWVGVVHTDGGSANSVRTSDAGEFSFERLPPGRYRISGHTGNRNATGEFTLAKNERKDGIVLVLGGGHSIRGVITGVSPAYLQQVRIGVFHESSWQNFEKVGVDARGAYEIQGVDPGKISVTAFTRMGRMITKQLQMPADADLVADFEFPRGARLSGNVTSGGKPVADMLVEPRPLKEQKLLFDGGTTSDRGEYVIEDVPDGEYFVMLGSYRSRNFMVNGDTVFDIDVPTTQLTGRILEEGGKVPVVGAEIYLWSTESDATGVQWHDRSNPFGEFKIVGLEQGDYVLSAYKLGYEMYRERISYGPDTDVVTIPLRQGKGVRIRVSDAVGGQPLRRATVVETIDGRRGSGLQLRLDENGVGTIPRAMAGSTLTFHAQFYVPGVISDWSGQEIEVQLQKERTP